MKRLFLYGLICFCSLLMIGCGCSNSKEPVDRINQDDLSGKFFESQTVDGIEISNFVISSQEDLSYISFDAKNTLNDNISVEYIKIYLYDNTDYLLLESYGYVGGNLATGEAKNVRVEVDIDLSTISRVSCEKM